jgi:hypothetical protein
VAADLCATANTDLGFGTLAARLLADGYVQTAARAPESLRLHGADGFERSVFASYFELSSDSRQTAELAHRRTFAEETTSFAVLLTDGRPVRALFLQAGGAIEEVEVEPLTSNAVFAVAHPLTAVLFGCSYNCNIVCGAVASAGAALAAGALCGPGITICAAIVFGGLSGGLAGAACNGICNSICEEAPPIRVYCGCRQGLGCYDSASACTALCRSGLGCFAQNLCGSNPICNTPLKQFT